VLVESLMEAARSGKEVTVVVELRARFDEEANIHLADQLHEAGCQVVYGVVGYKTHAKMVLVVRREKQGLVSYVHLGTGNYHAGTARVYTDYGLLSCDAELADEVHKVFRQLTGPGCVEGVKHLLQAPFTLHSGILRKIEREARIAAQGGEARIVAKMNSLVEPQIIKALYRASQAGVIIELLVRGICCLRPGVSDLSENIRVRSIMGRFLEHSRIVYFQNNGQSELYCGSADWMQRNFFSRVEVCFPILQKNLQQRVIEECLESSLQDNTQSWLLQSNGCYRRIVPAEGESPHALQAVLLQKLAR
ncbi:MAG: polyphosphate kinase 1, partial [Gammaproteobacteria bacterium]|nr:polyphosphate kinase 1 [Gammaproteobacteria bacterium]